MYLFALSQDASDFYTVGGFVVGVISFVLGAIALGYTLRQIREAREAAEASQSAAEAAKAAAEKTLAESKGAYGKFVGSFASRILADLKKAVDDQDWKLASVRADDLAEFVASVPHEIPAAGEVAALLRAFGRKFATGDSQSKPKFYTGKWNELILKLHAHLDRVNAPFGGESGKADPATGRTEATGDRTLAAPEDSSGASGVGEGDINTS